MALARNVTEALEAIRAQHPHKLLQPAAVVQAAKPASHPLHGYFEWDNRKAGEAFRLSQAEALIRRVRVLAPPPLASRPVYVSLLPDRATPGGGYRHVTDVRASVVLREAAKETAVREVVASIQRYLSLLALVGEEDDMLRQWVADVEAEALAPAE
jgi:hypothetical protein